MKLLQYILRVSIFIVMNIFIYAVGTLFIGYSGNTHDNIVMVYILGLMMVIGVGAIVGVLWWVSVLLSEMATK